MEYLFFGPYWLFVVVRALFTAPFGEANLGKFKDGDALVFGLLGAVIWFVLAIIVAALFTGIYQGITGKRK